MVKANTSRRDQDPDVLDEGLSLHSRGKLTRIPQLARCALPKDYLATPWGKNRPRGYDAV